MGKNDKSHVRILDYQQILDNKDLSKNIVLSDGEVVYVPRENKQVLLLGEIQNPGIVNNDPPQTLLEAITRRGGVTSDGNKSKVVVIRGGADKASVKTYNLKKIVKDGDMSQNIILQKGDIIYIPPTFMASTENVLNHVKSILSVVLSAESAISFWPQTRQVLETGKSDSSSGIVISPGQ
jgi:protein involved in polysaccharide export with SLBB domain